MKIYRLVSWIIIIGFSIAFILLLTLPYDDFIRYVSIVSGYEKTDRIAGLLTYYKFNIVRFMPLLLVFGGILMLLFQKSIYAALAQAGQWIKKIPSLAVGHLLEHTTNEFLILSGILVINLVVKGYLAATFPVTYDEAWTFINFTSRGVITSMTYYPAPNNHILHSVLTNITNLIPIFETTALRLPALLVNTLFVFFFYIFVRRLTNDKVTLILTTICCFLVPVMFYGFASRGYSLVMLFFTVGYFMVIQLLLTDENRRRNLFFLAVCGVLGLYTMPSFLYAYITLNGFLVGYSLYKKNYTLVRQAVLWCLFSTVVVLLLYMPVFIISGIGAVTSNSYVVPIGRVQVLKELLGHYNQTFEYLLNLPYAIVPAVGVSIAAYYFSQRKLIALFNLWILGITLLIPIIHSIIPFTRTWVYLSVPVLVSLGLLLELVIYGHKDKLLVRITSLAIAVALSLTSYRAILKQQHYAIEAARVNEFLLYHNVFSIYINEPLMDTYIVYEYKMNDLNLDCFIRSEDFEQRKREIEMVLYKKGSKPDFVRSEPVYVNEYYAIYRNPYYKP